MQGGEVCSYFVLTVHGFKSRCAKNLKAGGTSPRFGVVAARERCSRRPLPGAADGRFCPLSRPPMPERAISSSNHRASARSGTVRRISFGRGGLEGNDAAAERRLAIEKLDL